MSEERHDSFANDIKADKGVHAAQVAKPKGSLTASLCLTNTRPPVSRRTLDSSQPDGAFGVGTVPDPRRELCDAVVATPNVQHWWNDAMIA
jgi:hypothetical protein